jgi:CHAT domain-containing protein
MLNDRELYFQNKTQYWREKGTLSRVSRKRGFFSTALNLAQEALAVARETWPDKNRVSDSLNELIAAAAAKEDPSALQYANESIQIAQQQSNSAENTRMMADINLLLADLGSRKQDCKSALSDYDHALDLYRQLPEVTYPLYQVHKGKLFCFQRLDRQEDFADELKTVLALAEEYRATIREDDSRQAFFAGEQIITDVAAASALQHHDSQKAFDVVEASKARSLLDFVESKKTIAEVEKSFGPVARPLSAAEIQARLPEQVQLVQYAVLPDRLLIWIISKRRFDLIEKQITAADLEKKILAYREAILNKDPPHEIKQAGAELYQLLIPTDLDPNKQLGLLADKSLYQLPFASLVSGAGKYLLEDYALFYAPSASVLVLATDNARRKEQVLSESVLSVGNPDFDREDNPNLADLPDAETEAKVIAGNYLKRLEMVGSEATKEKFLLNFANVEVVHFAGHFVANRQSPGKSKLLFAGGDLRSKQLSDYKLPRAKLFVLSACETGFERYNKSEGAIGIARTLLALGVPLVVASQWKVDSEPTKDLMIAFHRNRKQLGLSSAESLRRAQLEILSRNVTNAPFYWAAFSLFGGYAKY